MAKGILTDDNDIEDDDIQLFHKIMVVVTILAFFQQFNISTFTYLKKKIFFEYSYTCICPKNMYSYLQILGDIYFG